MSAAAGPSPFLRRASKYGRETRRRLWSVEDERRLRALYPDTLTAALAARLRRSLAATYQRARQLHVAKSEAYLASPAACRLRRRGDEHPGRATQFPKGHVPANKGLRRPGYAPGRMAETQFRKGQRSGKAAEHLMPIGSTRLIDGYRYRKVSEVPNVPYTVNWKLESVLIWEAAHGPVPPGHAVAFSNGDKGDVRLETLELVSRRELLRRNSIHRLPPALVETIQALGALTRQIHRRETPHGREEQDRRPA